MIEFKIEHSNDNEIIVEISNEYCPLILIYGNRLVEFPDHFELMRDDKITSIFTKGKRI